MLYQPHKAIKWACSQIILVAFIILENTVFVFEHLWASTHIIIIFHSSTFLIIHVKIHFYHYHIQLSSCANRRYMANNYFIDFVVYLCVLKVTVLMAILD